MRRNAAFAAVAIATALAVGGCSLFKSDDGKKDAAAKTAPAEPIYEPITALQQLEIGTTRNGYVITAFGYAPGIGYGSPHLQPRRDGKPATDGYLDYDFVAEAPDPALNLGTGDAPARAIRADLLLKPSELVDVAGIRVHSLQGGLAINF